MSFIAAAIVGSAVVGGGLAYAGARKSAKAQEAAANRTAQSADKANQRELAWKSAYAMGIPGINAFSTEQEIIDAIETGGAFGRPFGPSTGAFPGYADQFTEQEGFEGKQFAQMVEQYELNKQFWDKFRTQQESQAEWMAQIPEIRERIAEKGFSELGKLVTKQAEDQAAFAEEEGEAKAAALSQMLAGANTNTVADVFRGFGGVGGGGPMNNQLMSNAMRFMPAVASANIEGQSKAAALRGAAEITSDPWAAGLYDRLITQKAADMGASNNYLDAFQTRQYAPQLAFMNATKGFSPGRVNSPDQTVPVFQAGNPGAGLSQFGNTLMGVGGQLLGNKLQQDNMKNLMDYQHQLNFLSTLPTTGTMPAIPPGVDPFANPVIIAPGTGAIPTT